MQVQPPPSGDALPGPSPSLHYHRGGKIALGSRVALATREDLSLAYTPGVADACRAIAADPAASFTYTARGNLVAVVSDGTAVLGLGDIGPEAALPVMEGKCLLFKRFGGVDALPLCLRASDDARLADAIAALAPTFGGILLEDVASPRCFALEAELRRRLPIPVFHDDQHGTAVVVAAGLLPALRATGRSAAAARAVVNGAGAAGTAVAEILLDLGLGDVVVCDRRGVLDGGLDPLKAALAARTNRSGIHGGLPDALRGADVFVGLSAAGALSAEMVSAMAPHPVVFALANPDPEIVPAAARAAGAGIVASGRSDDRNQINNALCFPGLFRGLLDCGGRGVTAPVKLAAARAIAALVAEDDLDRGIVVPDIFDPRVAPAVAGAVTETLWAQGLAARHLPAAEEARSAGRRIALAQGTPL